MIFLKVYFQNMYYPILLSKIPIKNQYKPKKITNEKLRNFKQKNSFTKH